ncbi:hypothetical protein [Photobacterium sp. TLY01]|uniref:hypothetical protein n=1 Tax=Photobacterium sp. TLY01 TaxID=2907534 RepID=UPI001F3B8FE5|nr:hypothetical protein [Photobacterium sp. TLY01]UIP28075.1 hypothetical protein LN341_00655 [Photobacterium sp. TLY01]
MKELNHQEMLNVNGGWMGKALKEVGKMIGGGFAGESVSRGLDKWEKSSHRHSTPSRGGCVGGANSHHSRKQDR